MLIMFIRICVLFTFVLTVLSCKKDDPVLKIEGVVKDSTILFDQEISGVSLKLLNNKLDGGTFNNSFSEITTVSSNANGFYQFEFDRENTVEYKIEGSKNNYFPFEALINPDNVQPGVIHVRNLDMKPKATVDFHFVNSTPENESDNITFQFLNASFDCPCCDNDEVELQGQTVDSTRVCDVYGNTVLRYFYTVNKTSSFYTVYDSITCVPFDTTFVEVTY